MNAVSFQNSDELVGVENGFIESQLGVGVSLHFFPQLAHTLLCIGGAGQLLKEQHPYCIVQTLLLRRHLKKMLLYLDGIGSRSVVS